MYLVLSEIYKKEKKKSHVWRHVYWLPIGDLGFLAIHLAVASPPDMPLLLRMELACLHRHTGTSRYDLQLPSLPGLVADKHGPVTARPSSMASPHSLNWHAALPCSNERLLLRHRWAPSSPLTTAISLSSGVSSWFSLSTCRWHSS